MIKETRRLLLLQTLTTGVVSALGLSGPGTTALTPNPLAPPHPTGFPDPARQRSRPRLCHGMRRDADQFGQSTLLGQRK